MADLAGNVSGVELAELLEITPRRVQQLAQDGIFPKDERDSYPLVDCVRAFVHFWKDRAEGRVATGIDIEKHRRAAAQARMAELDLAEREGTMIRTSVHYQTLVDVLQDVRSGVLNLPVQVAAELVGKETERDVVAVLQPAVERTLTDLVELADEVEGRTIQEQEPASE